MVALSTRGDLAEALLGNDTRHLAAVDALSKFTGGPEERTFDPATRQLLDDFRAGRNLDDVRAWATERSPLSYVEETNAAGVTAGQPVEASWKLQAASYDIPAGHKVMLVINAKDALYSDDNPALATLSVGSAAGTEAYLDLPLG